MSISDLFKSHVPGNDKVLPGKYRIACIGDSITCGYGVNGKTEQTWEYVLNQELGEKFQVLNYGVNGTTAQSGTDHPYIREKIFQKSLECGAEVYLIMLGTNDANVSNWDRNLFRISYKALVRKYTELRHKPLVFLMIPPACFEDPSSGISGFGVHPEYLEEAAKIIRQIGKDLEIPVIDLTEATYDHPEWFMDGVHPNAEGNRGIGEYIAEYLRHSELDSMHPANA